MNIRTTLVAAATAALIIPLIVLTAIIGSQINAKSKISYEKTVTSISEKQAHSLSSLIESYSRRLTAVTQNVAVKDFADAAYLNAGNAARTEVEKVLGGMVGAGTGFSALFLYEKSGVVIASSAGAASYEITPEILAKMSPGNVYAISVGQSRSVYNLFCLIPLNGDVRLLASMSGEEFNTVISSASFAGNGRLMLMDPDLHIIDDTKYLGDLRENFMPEYAEFRHQIEGGADIDNRLLRYDVAKKQCIAYITPVGDTGWFVVTTGEVNKAHEAANAAISSLSGITVVAALLFESVIILMALWFAKPLSLILSTLSSISRGDHEARVNIVNKNEFGIIARAINDLMDDVIVSEGRYRTIVGLSDDIIFEWNLEKDEVYFSQNFNKKFSYRAPSDSFADSFLIKCRPHTDDAARYQRDIDDLKHGRVFKQNEYRWKNMYGDYIWILMRLAAIKNNDGEVIKVIGVVVDIDRAKKNEKVLNARASFDALTGLYKRETVENLINNEIDLVSARKNEFAILFVDVDDFKHYNDDYSHATGDQVLQFIARGISDTVSEFGIAGRYGGDEFVICVRNSDTNDPARVAQDIIARLKDGFICDMGERLTVNVSIGIAVIKNASHRVDEIIGLADDAMYKVKKSGKSNFVFAGEY